MADESRSSGKENRAPSSTLVSRRSVAFSPAPLYHPYKVASSSSPNSSDTVEVTLGRRVLIRHDSSDPAALVPKNGVRRLARPRSILKPTSHPINVVACAEEGKQRNAPRRHSLFHIDFPDPDTVAPPLSMAVASVPLGAPVLDLLSSAVESLEASLDNSHNVTVEPTGMDDNCSPRSSLPPPVAHPPSPPRSSSPLSHPKKIARIGLRDIEVAYTVMATQLRRIAAMQGSNSALLEVVAAATQTIVTCVTRELDNVLRPAPASLPSTDSSEPEMVPSGMATPASNKKGKKQGRPEAELRRRRVELEVGQAAIKLLGVLMHHAIFHPVFTVPTLVQLLESVVRIPFVPTLKSAGDREIIAFASWLMGTQTLPAADIIPMLPRMAYACQAVLGAPAKANDKTRRIMAETLGAVEHLLDAHPAATIPHHRHYLPHALRYLVSAHPILRAAAACTIGRLALLSADGQHAQDISRKANDHFTTRLGADPQRPSHVRTHLTTLSEHVENAHNAGELPWAVSVVSLLPVLTGERFRSVEDGGPKLWMGRMQGLLYQANTPAPIRTLARFAWNHLAYAWVLSSEAHLTSQPHSHRVWALSEKPAELLFQILGRDESYADKVDKPARLRTIVALLYALSGFLAGHADLHHLETQYSRLWNLVVANHVSSLLLSTYDDAASRTAIWVLLASICGGGTAAATPWTTTRLISRTIVAGVPTRHASDLGVVVEAAIAETVRPDEVPAFAPAWLLANADRVLPVLVSAFRSCMTISNASGELPASLESAWRGYLSSIATAYRADTTNLQNAFDETCNAINRCLATLGPLPFASRLEDIKVEILRDLPASDVEMTTDASEAGPVDITKGDFALLAQTSGVARAQLWASLAPTWLSAFQIVGPLGQAEMISLLSFAVMPIDAAGEVPAAVPLLLDVLECVGSAEVLTAQLIGVFATQSEHDRMRSLTAILEASPSPLVCRLLAPSASATLRSVATAEEAVAGDLLRACALCAEAETTGAFAKMLAIGLVEVFKAQSEIAVDMCIDLYAAILGRLTDIVEPTQTELAHLEPFLECLGYQLQHPSAHIGVKALGAFWRATFGKVDGVKLNEGAALLIGLLHSGEAISASQLSLTISAFNSQNGLSQSQQAPSADDVTTTSDAYEADISHITPTQLPRPTVEEALPVVETEQEPIAMEVDDEDEVEIEVVKHGQSTKPATKSSLSVIDPVAPDEGMLAVEPSGLILTSTPNVRKRKDAEPVSDEIIKGSLDSTPSSDGDTVIASSSSPARGDRKRVRRSRSRSSEPAFELVVPTFSPRDLLRRSRSQAAHQTSSSPSVNAATQQNRRSSLRRSQSANDAYGALPPLKLHPARAMTEEPSVLHVSSPLLGETPPRNVEKDLEEDLFGKLKLVLGRADDGLRAKLAELDVDALEALLRSA